MYKEAADLGNASGMYGVALSYKNGRGVEQSDNKAFEWFLKAGKAGSGAGCIEAGYCYNEGKGTKRDVEQAVYWIQKGVDIQTPENTNPQILTRLDELKAELNASKVTTVTNEPFTMKTSKFSVKGTYTGEWKDGKPNGEGTMTMSQDDDRWNKGDTLWSKSWSNGLIEGYGQWRSAVDGAYDGNFSKGLKSGYGKMWFSDGTVYDGQWSGGDFAG